MGWMCAQWLRFRLAKGFSDQLAVECVLATQSCAVRCSFLILLSFSLSPEQRPAEFEDPANPFLIAQQSWLNHVCTLSSGVTDHSWSVIRSYHPPRFGTHMNWLSVTYHNVTYGFTATVWSRPNHSLHLPQVGGERRAWITQGDM